MSQLLTFDIFKWIRYLNLFYFLNFHLGKGFWPIDWLTDRQIDRQTDQKIGFISFSFVSLVFYKVDIWYDKWLMLNQIHLPGTLYSLISICLSYICKSLWFLSQLIRYCSSLSCTILIAWFSAEVCALLLRCLKFHPTIYTHLSFDLWRCFIIICQCMFVVCIRISVKCSQNNSSVMTAI